MADRRVVVPRGVPTVSYVRILPQGEGGDLITDGNAITILDPGRPSTRHDVAHVLARGMSDEEVCENTIGNLAGAGIGASLNPVSAVVADAATSLIILVGSRQTRKWQYLKRVFLPFLANELFALLNEKEQQHTQDYTSQISFSAFEVQDEIITDLLRPSSRGLAVSVSAEEGVMVPGLHRETVRDENSLRRMFVESCENRASHTLPLGASIDTSAALWEILLYQTEGMSESTTRCFSKLVVLDLPSVDSLLGLNSEMRQLESLTLHKSLMAFVDVARRLSNPTKAAMAPFRASKLTHYLSEMLGGNAIVVALGLLAGGEAACSRKTLDVLGALTSAVHYPVGGKELTDVLQGLLAKYRSMILQLQDEILNGAPVGEKAPELSEKRMNDLQRELASAQIERNTAKEDRARIFEMMELLKAKYSTLVNEKAAQSQELIKAEEDKLSVARALVELKLEHSARQEQAEKEKFELTSALLAAKNEIFDLDAQLLLARTEASTLRDSSSELEVRLQKDQEDLAASRASLQEVRDQLSREIDKNLEVGAELLTLINQKDVLQRRVDDLQQKVDVANVKLAAVTNQENDMKKSQADSLSALRAREEEISLLKRAVADVELDVKRMTLEMEHLHQDMERKEEEWIREREAKDAALVAAKESANKQAFNVRAGGDELVSGRAGIKYEQKLRDMQREVKRLQDDLGSLTEEKDTLDQELAKTRESYRRVLAVQIGQPGVGGVTSIEMTSAQIDELFGALVGTFNEREQKLNSRTDAALTVAATLKAGLRNLFDKYQTALDGMEENLPLALNPIDPILNEQVLIGEDALKDAIVLLEDSARFERETIRERIQNAENELVAEQERMNLILATYKKSLEKAEFKLAEARRKEADMAIQIQQLVAAGPIQQQAQAIGGRAPVREAPMGGVAEQAQLLRSMQEQFANQIQQLQAVKVSGGGDTAVVAQTPLQTSRDAVLRTDPTPRAPYSSSLTSPQPVLIPEFEQHSAAPVQLIGATPTTLEEAIKYIQQLESGANPAVIKQLRESEKRATQLTSRVSELEAELKTYQEYMRNTVLEYKKKLQSLHSQMPTAKSKAGKIVGLEGAKLPPL